MIQAITIIASGCLFAWGGYNFLLARRLFMPIVISAALLFLTHSLWSLAAITAYGCLCLGYGDNSPFRHIFGNGWGRGVWGFLVAFALSLAMFITGHLPWYLFLIYAGLGFTLENALKDIPQIVGDFIIGAGFGSIVLFIH
jgi:hypothetical protein